MVERRLFAEATHMIDPDDISYALRERLKLLVPINKLIEERQLELLKHADVIEFKKGEYLFKQGDKDDFSFYLLSGDLDLTADDQLIKRLSGGEGASFQPLSQLQPRKMSALARSAGEMFRVNRPFLDKLLSLEPEPPVEKLDDTIEVTEITTTADKNWLMTMLQSDLFSRLPPSNIQTLLDSLESVEVKVGEYVVRQDEPGDYYYAVQSGHCEVLRRSGGTDRLVRLATLGPGDTFGEEALISNAKRNASVRMTSDGELARLTKDHFIELIRTPVMRGISRTDAEKKVAEGARWIDVRYPEEFEANGLDGANNIPLHLMRNRYDRLDDRFPYIAYCDTGGRSSIACFLLTEHGFDCSFVDGGLTAELNEINTSVDQGSEPDPEEVDLEASSAELDALAATVNAHSLTAELGEATLKLQYAQQLMDQAESAKSDADRIVAERLEQEREGLYKEAERARRTLEDAERVREEIEKEQRAAMLVAEQKQKELERQLSEFKVDAETRLRAKEHELQTLYEKSAADMERLQAEKLDTTQELVAKYEKAEELAKKKDAEAEKLRSELLAAEERRMRELEDQERRLREDLQAQLLADRRRLEAELGTLHEELEKTKKAERSALAAKEAAAAEAKRIIDEFTKSQEEIRKTERARLATEREELEAEASKIRASSQLALKAKAEAETARRVAEQEITSLKQQLEAAVASTTPPLEATLKLEKALEAEEARAKDATVRLTAATEAHVTATNAHEKNLEALELTYQSEAEIDQVLRRELEAWMNENEHLKGDSTVSEFRPNEAVRKRINSKAREAKRASEARVRALFDDLQNFDLEDD